MAHSAPMVLDAYLLQNPGAGIETLPAQVLGARVFPTGYVERREDVSKEKYQRAYNELGPMEQADIDKQMEALNLPKPGGVYGERLEATGAAAEDYGNKLELLTQQLFAGEIAPKAFREREVELRAARNVLYEDIQGRFPEQAPRELEANQQMLQQYMQYFRPDPVSGVVDYDAAEAFRDSLSPEQQAFLKESQGARLERLPVNARRIMIALTDARERLKPYFEMWKKEMVKRGLFDQWKKMSPKQQKLFKDTPQYKAVNRTVTRQKEQWRLKNPDGDRLLSNWGYVSKTMAERG